MLTDIELLRRYAEDGSEAPFGELVHRHVNLVYSTALRLVGGDEHLDSALQCVRGLVIFASNNGDRLPGSLEEVGLDNSLFELVFKGSLKDLAQLETTIVVREKQAWRTPKGTWARAYGFADAHSEVALAPDGNFDNWERERARRGDQTAAVAKE